MIRMVQPGPGVGMIAWYGCVEPPQCKSYNCRTLLGPWRTSILHLTVRLPISRLHNTTWDESTQSGMVKYRTEPPPPSVEPPWTVTLGDESKTFCVADQVSSIRAALGTSAPNSNGNSCEPVVEIFKVLVPGLNFNMARYGDSSPSSDSMFTEWIRRMGPTHCQSVSCKCMCVCHRYISRIVIVDGCDVMDRCVEEKSKRNRAAGKEEPSVCV
mmetsp:Transcript_5868/g.6566  ORF Transcript_5868/g.6566 Transcript_5868/m.6566 type:complete len:213 (-) Transcript_5868:136-774(-)